MRRGQRRRGDVGNDKLCFDFISRGDDRHHEGSRSRGCYGQKKKEKKYEIGCAVDFVVRS